MATTTKQLIELGQRVYSSLYGGRYGTICAVRPNDHYDVAFDHSSISQGIPGCILRGVQWQIFSKIFNQSQISECVANCIDFQSAKALEAEQATQRRITERATHLQSYPELTPISSIPSGWSISRLAAANLRKQLKKAFPGHKFSVKVDGNSIDVRWDFGPTESSVQAITRNYVSGYFDGMTDSYTYSPDNTFGDVFGSVRYLFTHREFPGETLTTIDQFLCNWYSIDYSPNARIGNQYISTITRNILSTKPVAPHTKILSITRNNSPTSSDFPCWFDLIVSK
jgi:hypothetical protein